MKSSEIRRKFIDFFKSKEHTYVPSSSTIPAGDQTILFTIAGMAQFKAALTGQEIRPYKRATNSQKCIRIGDLDDVGKDGRHLTMFEMLGSWSFGDYYKKEAIEWAYELARDVLKFDFSKLWISTHTSDDEATELWKKVGIQDDRIVRLGDKDNFWAMGPTGPCGPCTEMHIDQGIEVGKCTVKGYPCQAKPGCDCDRFLEFWNLVFMQYDRKEDGTLVELPMKSVDTGSGLERVAALVQGKTTAFDIDSFVTLKSAIAKRAGLETQPFSAPQKESLNVVADHIRTLTFTLADGANFSNEGRGYVLRRVLRRAVRHVHRLNPKWPKGESFLAGIVDVVVQEFSDFYPEIEQNKKRVIDLITHEEARFTVTLENGLERFQAYVNEAKQKGKNELPGEQIFALHDSFGFPSDLTRILCEEINFKADLDGFEKAMKAQKEKSRNDAKFYKFDQDDSPWIEFFPPNQQLEKQFNGYGLVAKEVLFQGKLVSEVPVEKRHIKRVRQLKNKCFEVVLESSPFYPEGGGQVADSGWLLFTASSENHVFEIVDVRKTPAAIVQVLRHPEFSQEDAPPLEDPTLKAMFGNPATALVDMASRLSTARNHTATHLLHKALQVTLGENVRQAGSLVSPQGLRFDFSHNKAVTLEELKKIERIVNEEVLKNTPVNTHENVPIETAKKMGAMAMFDEKYDDHVRVLEVPGFSLELCGGTHVTHTGEIGLFKITSEGSVTSGVRRIEAVTGMGAYQFVEDLEAKLLLAAEEARCAPTDLQIRIASMRENLKDAEKNLASLQSKLVNAQMSQISSEAREIAPQLTMVAKILDVSTVAELELFADRIKEQGISIVIVGSQVDGKAVVLSAVSKTALTKHKTLSAGYIVKAVCELLDGKGGGRPDFARGGGTSPAKLSTAFSNVEEIVRKLL